MPSLPRVLGYLLPCFLALATTAEAARQAPQPPSTRGGPGGGWVIEGIGSLGTDTTTFASAINSRNEIAGYSYTDTPDPSYATTFHGFTWDGRMEDAGTPAGSGPGVFSYLADINDSGVAVGNHNGKVYLYKDGKWSPLGRGLAGDPAGINKSGAVAGIFYSDEDQRYHAFLYQGGQLRDFGSMGGSTYVSALNDKGAVVGTANDANFVGRAYVYEKGRMTDLGAGPMSQAIDINNQGAIVGMYYRDLKESTFISERGRLRQLFTSPERTRPKAMNNRGDVVGQMAAENGAFLYKDGTVTRLDQLPEVVAAGWTHLVVEDINDRGWITGYGLKSDAPYKYRAFVLRPR